MVENLLSVEYLPIPNYLFCIAYPVLQLFVHLNSRICRLIATFLLAPSLPAIVQSKQFQIYHAIAGPVRSCPQGFIQENLKQILKDEEKCCDVLPPPPELLIFQCHGVLGSGVHLGAAEPGGGGGCRVCEQAGEDYEGCQGGI